MHDHHYGFWHFLWDIFLTGLTCGLWLVYLIYKALRKNS